jgi:hypothetical protein
MIRLYDQEVLESTPRTPPIPHACSHIFQGKPYGFDVWSDIAQLSVAYARTQPFQGNPFGETTLNNVTSDSHATSGHAQWYILYYYYSRKNARNRLCTRSRWFPVTWLPVLVTSLPVAPPRFSLNPTLAVPIYYLPKTLKFEWEFLFNTTYVHLS